MRAKLTLMSLLVAILTAAATFAFTDQPSKTTVAPFSVVAEEGPAVTLVVDRATPDDQLVALLKMLRTMRAKNALSSLFPPTTPTMPDGPYQVIIVYVMDNADWATAARLQAFVNPRTSSISADEKAFGSHVLAHYYFTAPFRKTPLEEGTIGFMDEGYQYTETYRKVF